MSFLDRFKPQPKWKHADPTVRAAAVAELDDRRSRAATCARRARGNGRGRSGKTRGCRARRHGRAIWSSWRATERDEQLRRELTDRLVAVATAPSDSDGDAALALGGLTDQKQLASVAKSSPHETVQSRGARARA